MKPILEDIQKTMPGVEPIFNHHMSVANSLRALSDYFFDMGMKIKDKGSNEQFKKYREITGHLNKVRGAVAQNFIHEAENNAHCQNKRVYEKRISELEKHVDALRKQIEFLK